jgi:DNA-binding response OmpR family regulator
VIVAGRGTPDEKLAALVFGPDDFMSTDAPPDDVRRRIVHVRDRRRAMAAVTARQTRIGGGELTYEAFVAVAREQLQRAPAALALLKVPAESADEALAGLRDEVRRRDVIGCCDPGHVMLLLPQMPAAGARDRLTQVFEGLQSFGVRGLHAGVAATTAAGAHDFEHLAAAADEALREARALGAPAVVHGEPAGRAARAPRDQTIVLAVRDEDADRSKVDARVRASGYNTMMASDGTKAWAAVRGRPPDAVAIDVTLPGARELLEGVGSLAGPRPVVVALAPAGSAALLDRALAGGAQDYMALPVEAGELAARIARLLR